MLVKFSPQYTEKLCNGLYKIETYKPSIFSRYGFVAPSLKAKAANVRKDLRTHSGITHLDSDTLEVLLYAAREFGGIFYDMTLTQKIDILKWKLETHGGQNIEFMMKDGEKIAIID